MATVKVIIQPINQHNYPKTHKNRTQITAVIGKQKL